MVLERLRQWPKVVFANFAKFTGKHLCQSFLFNKTTGWRSANLLKRPRHMCFPVTFEDFLRTPPGDCFGVKLIRLFNLEKAEFFT